MKLDEKIITAIEPSLNHSGYEIVNLRVVGGRRAVVGIDIERFDDAPVTLEDCVNANHLVSAILDVEDFIKGSYNLEISSPGEYRSLKKISDFKRFCGKDVEIELLVAVNGKCKIFGELLRVEQNVNDVVVYLKEECDTGTIEIKVPYSGIKKANVKRF
ncbi:MAG: ribosome maturation factor RimP [Holosporaceae bacterium]|nr:ribosome maturation factor RimP [Holosporaceae bacterium]